MLQSELNTYRCEETVLIAVLTSSLTLYTELGFYQAPFFMSLFLATNIYVYG